jgi:hypothetical protein
MDEQYLAGTNKYWRDAIWSLLLAASATFYRDAPSFIYAIWYMIAWFAQIFVIFFLCLWKKEDAQSYQARYLLSTMLWFSFMINSFGACLWLYCILFVEFNYEKIFTVLFTIFLAYLIIKKYYNLMD